MKVTVVVCDWCLDQTALVEARSTTIGGVTFDLCPGHGQRWEELREGLSGLSDASSDQPQQKTRRARSGRAAKSGVKSTGKSTGKSTVKSTVKRRTSPVAKPAPRPTKPPVDPKAVRAWANVHGLRAPSRGPLPASLVEAFLAAPVNQPVTVATFQQP